jgi:hypothetical protein
MDRGSDTAAAVFMAFSTDTNYFARGEGPSSRKMDE